MFIEVDTSRLYRVLLSLLFKHFLDDEGQSFASPLLHIVLEPGQHRHVDLAVDVLLLSHAVRLGKRVHPIPILFVMQIAVDVRLITVVLWPLFGVARSLLVAQGGSDVVAVVVAGLQLEAGLESDRRQDARVVSRDGVVAALEL